MLVIYFFITKATRTIDFINTYNFPLVIFNVSLNEYAREYFSIDFNGPILMQEFNTNISISIAKAHKPVLKLKFDRLKYIKENYNCNCRSQASLYLNKHHNQKAKLRLHTNYTSFDVELFVYDGLIQIVSYLLKLKKRREMNKKLLKKVF
jgi:hypothetical protein